MRGKKREKKRKENKKKKREDCVDCHYVSEKEMSKKKKGGGGGGRANERKERPCHSRSSESPGFVGSLRHGSKLPYLHQVPVPEFLFGSCPPS